MEQTDRPRPENHHRVADFDAVVVHAVEATRERLRKRQLRRVECGVRLHQLFAIDGLLRDQHVFSEATVDVVADEVGTLAQVLVAPPAAAADPAVDRRRQTDQIALGEVVDALADLRHMAGHLVAEYHAQRNPLGLLTSQNPQVGAANRVGTNAHHHLAWTSFRFGQFAQFGGDTGPLVDEAHHLGSGHEALLSDRRCTLAVAVSGESKDHSVSRADLSGNPILMADRSPAHKRDRRATGCPQASPVNPAPVGRSVLDQRGIGFPRSMTRPGECRTARWTRGSAS